MNKQAQSRKSNSSEQNSKPTKSFPIYLQLAAGMTIFGSGTPTSKLVTDAFPTFLASNSWVAIATVVLLPFLFKERQQISKLQRRD